MLPSKLR